MQELHSSQSGHRDGLTAVLKEVSACPDLQPLKSRKCRSSTESRVDVSEMV